VLVWLILCDAKAFWCWPFSPVQNYEGSILVSRRENELFTGFLAFLLLGRSSSYWSCWMFFCRRWVCWPYVYPLRVCLVVIVILGVCNSWSSFYNCNDCNRFWSPWDNGCPCIDTFSVWLKSYYPSSLMSIYLWSFRDFFIWFSVGQGQPFERQMPLLSCLVIIFPRDRFESLSFSLLIFCNYSISLTNWFFISSLCEWIISLGPP